MISIIIASFNKERFISETISSVIDQSFQNWELLIVDDCSTDQTISVIRSFFEKDKRIKLFVNAKNSGANYSRNLGIREAKGAYLIFLDADDLLASDCLAKRYQYMTANRELDFSVFSMGVFKTKVGDSHFKWVPHTKNAPLRRFLAHDLPWTITQPVWKRSFLLNIGGFDEDFLRMQDVELHTRALLQSKVKFSIVAGEPDCYYRIEESRLNYSVYEFLSRWTDSAIKYYSKFITTLQPAGLHTALLGTIYKTYCRILYSYKMKQITAEEFNDLQSRLIGRSGSIKLSYIQRILFQTGGYFNISKIRVPGINWSIHKLIQC
jgi:glycosyltransferase involved in cell wall biosynthesis